MAGAVAAKRNRYNSSRATYGSVAYGLDYRQGGAITAPRPLVRPREETVARPRIRVREAGRVSLFAVVGAMAIGVFAVLVLLSGIQLTTISDDIAGLKREITTLQSKEAQLVTQYELAFDLASIEAAVTINGSMAKPQDGQVIYLDLSEPDSVVLAKREETPLKGVEGMLHGVREVFSNVVAYFK